MAVKLPMSLFLYLLPLASPFETDGISARSVRGQSPVVISYGILKGSLTVGNSHKKMVDTQSRGEYGA